MTNASREVYTNPGIEPTANPPEHRSVGKPIEAAKALIPVIDLADLLCGPGQLRRVGREWAGRCPLPDHVDRSPSFTVNPEKNVWFCHGCLRGGGVVDLARAAWGFPDDGPGAAEAAAYLLAEFGHPIPERPAPWYARQDRQRPVRDRIERGRVEHVRLLVFRLIWLPWLRGLPDRVREEASESAWAESRQIAAQLYAQRRGA